MQYDACASVAEMEARMKKIHESVEQMRKAGIPTVWIALGDRNALHKPASNNTTARDTADIERAGFFGHPPGEIDKAHLKEFKKLMKQYGPKKDEAIFTKTYFGSFSEPDDLKRPGLASHIKGQHNGDAAATALSGKTLHEYLQSLHTQRVTIMGCNSDVCVMETAMGAAMKGMKSVVISDRVMSEDDKSFSKPDFQEDKVRTKLHNITDNPAALRDDLTHKAFANAQALTTEEKGNIRENIDVKRLTELLPAAVPKSTSSAAARRRTVPKA